MSMGSRDTRLLGFRRGSLWGRYTLTRGGPTWGLMGQFCGSAWWRYAWLHGCQFRGELVALLWAPVDACNMWMHGRQYHSCCGWPRSRCGRRHLLDMWAAKIMGAWRYNTPGCMDARASCFVSTQIVGVWESFSHMSMGPEYGRSWVHNYVGPPAPTWSLIVRAHFVSVLDSHVDGST